MAKKHFRKFEMSNRVKTYRRCYELLIETSHNIDKVMHAMNKEGYTGPGGFSFTRQQVSSMAAYISKLKREPTMRSSLRVIFEENHAADAIRYQIEPIKPSLPQERRGLNSQIIEDLLTSNMNDKSKIELLTRLVKS